jgi:hypothetical protein
VTVPVYLVTTAAAAEKRIDLANGSTMIRETMPRWATTLAAMAAQTSGTEYMYGVPLFAGDTVTGIGGFTARTQPVQGTGADGHGYFALRDNTGALLAYSADTVADWTSWTAGLELAKPLTKNAAGGTISSYAITTDGWYFLCCMVATGTGTGQVNLALGGNTAQLSRISNGYNSATGQRKLAATGGTTGQTTATPASSQTPSFGITTVAYGFAY